MSDVDEVLAAEARRAAAVKGRDIDALQTCLSNEVVYVHATGLCHDGPQWVEYVRTGPVFHEVRLEPRSVRVLGDVAIVFGDLHLRFQRGEVPPIEARSLATAIWVRDRGDWLLTSFQSTRPAERAVPSAHSRPAS